MTGRALSAVESGDAHGASRASRPASAPASLVHPSLLEICRAMASPLALGEVLETILRLTVQEMQAQQGSILLFDEHQDELKMLASRGLPEEMARKGYVKRKGSIAEWVIEHARPLILNDRPSSPEFKSLDDKRQIVSSMCVPLIARGGVIGTLNLNRTDPGLPVFTELHLEAMDILASQAAICIDNARLHESLIQTERLAAIGQTVAGISHCVKNMLTGMSGGLSLARMARDRRDWDMSGQGLEILGHSVGRISTLVMDMLDYSKERAPEIEKVDLRSMLAELVEATLTQAKLQEAEVFIAITPGAETVQADEGRLFRAMLNLVQNALDVSPPRGIVSIRVERTDAEGALRRLRVPAESAILIHVTDQGMGIAEDTHPHLFEPFFSTKGSRGTGLGLACSRKILREHGGELELVSGPCEPAEFILYLRG